MAFENVRINSPNFCVGPQTGTFCFVDTSDLSVAYMRVKNNSGDLIRSYSFLPADVFYTDQNTFPYNYVVDLKYVGPKGLSFFYNGAVFYTLERIITGRYSVNEETRVTYSDACVIRKWVLNEDAFTLSLDNTWRLNSNSVDYFDTFSISIKALEYSLSSSTTRHTGEIELTTVSGISVGDELLLGPSTDNDNVGAVDTVYVYDITGNVVTIRNYDGTTPPENEYVVGDKVTLVGSVYLFSNPRPLLGASSGSSVNYGSGVDGNLTINTLDTVINNYTYITDSLLDYNQGYTIVADSSYFNVGDEVLLHQTQDYTKNAPGIYEFKKIQNIVGNTIVFDSPTTHSFISGQPDALEAAVTQVISVPNFYNLTVTSSGSITCKKWDGYTGGVVVFRASGVVYFETQTGGIDVSAMGFRGGGDNGGGNNAPGDPGESYVGLGWHNNPTASNCNPNATGGGGGYGPSGYGGTAGGGGGAKYQGEDATDDSNPPAIARGGEAFTFDAQTHLMFGGAGGGGGDDDNQTVGVCKGGDSGGIVIIQANTIKDCVIKANGEKGTDAGGAGAGTGGGGAGGTIYIKAVNYTELEVTSTGGEAGIHPTDTAGKGSDGFVLLPESAYPYLTGFEGQGFLYELDQSNYCSVVDKKDNAKFANVLSSVWNNTTAGLSFVKANTFMTVDVNDNYENIKAQTIRTLTQDYTLLNVYALDYIGTDVYFLQDKVIKYDDTGVEAVIRWQDYNYVLDTILPYNYSTNVIIDKQLLLQQEQVVVHIYVRDQFGNGVYGANVFVSYQGDPAALLDPISGYVVTDANGYCSVTYKAGQTYTGFTTFTVKADKANSSSGSSYTVCTYTVQQFYNFSSYCNLFSMSSSVDGFVGFIQKDYKTAEIFLRMYSKYIFGVGHYHGTEIEYDYNNGLSSYFNRVLSLVRIKMLQQALVPTMAEEQGRFFSEVINYIQTIDKEAEISLVAKSTLEEEMFIPQMIASRRIHGLNNDHLTLNQYIFISDARPAFWSEKVSVNTDIWLRMRPFAYSLDPNTLVFKICEVNENLGIDTGFTDVTALGETTLFDAGGGMFGVDFYYQPTEFFRNESIIFVDVVIFDMAPTPNVLHVSYWFKIIDDYKGPRVYNIEPPEDSVVERNTPISFFVTDDGLGLDISSMEVLINDSLWSYTYEEVEPGIYKVVCDFTDRFPFGATISVNVQIMDKSKHQNVTFAFWSIKYKNSTGPWVDMEEAIPKKCSRGVSARQKNISFQVYAIDGNGLDEHSISIQIAGKDFTDNFLLLPIIYRK